MSEPIVRRLGDVAPIRNAVGGDIVFALRGEETNGGLTALESTVPPGEGPPLHTHAHEDECLIVLEGTFQFRLRDDVEAAPAGSLVFVPRGVPHTWQNAGTTPGRMLVLFTPSGMERFFDRFSTLGGTGPAAFAEAAAGTGMEVVGPPLAQSHPL
jgi:quercetin dioxygenase-like cupin family protein